MMAQICEPSTARCAKPGDDRIEIVVRSLIAGWKSTPEVWVTAGVMVLSAVELRRMMVFSGVMPRCEVRDSRNGSVLAPQGRTSRSPTPSSRQGRHDPPRRNEE